MKAFVAFIAVSGTAFQYEGREHGLTTLQETSEVQLIAYRNRQSFIALATVG
jgi:hypothetical protein